VPQPQSSTTDLRGEVLGRVDASLEPAWVSDCRTGPWSTDRSYRMVLIENSNYGSGSQHPFVSALLGVQDRDTYKFVDDLRRALEGELVDLGLVGLG
jgi:hypothetical protein